MRFSIKWVWYENTLYFLPSAYPHLIEIMLPIFCWCMLCIPNYFVEGMMLSNTTVYTGTNKWPRAGADDPLHIHHFTIHSQEK